MKKMKKLKETNGFKAIIFIVVMLIPLIYSFFYLKSYWNPYGNLSDMKIAVVNLDKGKDDKKQGDEFVQSLKDSDTFNICEVSKDNAEEGMKKGTYYATIEIPENFTECLESAETEDKQIAQITYSPNQATNYLATQIVNSAVKTIELSLQSKVDKEIISKLASKLNEVPDSLQEISNGADQVLNGSESLNDGIKQINDGTSTLSNSYKEFDNGVESAYNGSESLNNGISQVSNGVDTLKNGGKTLDDAITKINQGADELSTQGSQGITALANGANDLNNGAQSLNQGVSQYVEGAESLADGTTNYVTSNKKILEGTNAYVSGVSTLNEKTKAILEGLSAYGQTSTDPKVQYLATQAQAVLDYQINGVKAFNYLEASGKQLQAGTKEISKYNDQLTNGASSLKTALSQVKQGTTSLNKGISTLQIGTNKLSDGSSSLETGLEKLNSSSKTVDNALGTLNDGTETAYEGSSQLVSGVQTFKTSIDEGMEDTKEQLKTFDGIDEFGEDPVEFKTEEYGKVDSYGIAFTPLFLCIGLWVGALMAYVVLYYDHDERFGIFGMNAKNKILQNIIYLGLGAVEGLITGILLKAGLGYEIQNMALYYGASILIGITFMSIIQFLIRNFGDIGKFLALIILVLQLAAAGGTFPIETIDKGFQAVSAYLPMTYSIKLLREILVPTEANFKGMYIGILIGIIAVTMFITSMVDLINDRKCANKENA